MYDEKVEAVMERGEFGSDFRLFRDEEGDALLGLRLTIYIITYANICEIYFQLIAYQNGRN